MTSKQKEEARKRILKAATALFAQKGYAAVGIREIANTAQVNISMISYYFQGKVGILRSLINEFHDLYSQVFSEAFDNDKSAEDNVRAIVRKMVDFIRNNTELAMVSFNSIPLDIPEIMDLKIERVTKTLANVSGLFKRLNLDSQDPALLSVIGTGLISIILSHFRLKNIQKIVYDAKFDDTFYENYTKNVETLFLYGINGFSTQKEEEESIDSN
ncbi:MAG: TetR family transcriptional regulator [Candidatus Cloacimonetes bacterium]|nr:TetR family transcriptional regulator [Candidatus Cloacimonadota bacterium]